MLDKVVVVTGGASGIGLGSAKLLASEGASVVVTDVVDAAAVVAQELGGRGMFVKHDVASAADWQRLMDLVTDKYGHLDALVNSAGVAVMATMLDTDQDNWDLHYRVNQLGPFLGMKAAAERMKDTGGGSIVNISSLAALQATRGIFAYGTTKWAVRGMSKQAAMELGMYGIRVNSIYPGATQTPMMGSGPGPETFINTIPLGRVGQPVDVANLVRFLVSDESSYMSGAEIAITGGR